MKIAFVYMKNLLGAVDFVTGDIILSLNQSRSSLLDTLKHELAHIFVDDWQHSPKWYDRYCTFGGLRSCPYPIFDSNTTYLADVGYAANIGNISGIQNILTDYHLLQSYRRASAKILGTEGHWDVVGEVDGGPGDQLIRLYPTPKGAFPVVVVYYPVVSHFRSPQAKHVAYDMLLAEAKIMVGQVRRKIAGIPLPDGSSLGLDGEAMVSEGTEERNGLIEKAIYLGEPLPIVTW